MAKQGMSEEEATWVAQNCPSCHMDTDSFLMLLSMDNGGGELTLIERLRVSWVGLLVAAAAFSNTESMSQDVLQKLKRLTESSLSEIISVSHKGEGDDQTFQYIFLIIGVAGRILESESRKSCIRILARINQMCKQEIDKLGKSPGKRKVEIVKIMNCITRELRALGVKLR